MRADDFLTFEEDVGGEDIAADVDDEYDYDQLAAAMDDGDDSDAGGAHAHCCVLRAMSRHGACNCGVHRGTPTLHWQMNSGLPIAVARPSLGKPAHVAGNFASAIVSSVRTTARNAHLLLTRYHHPRPQ